MEITKAEKEAIKQNDSYYLLSKGVSLYNKGAYKEAMEYYEIAAAMGDAQAISNLGYCYFYGRDIQKDEEKGLLFFQIAANQNNVDALYKIGSLYLSGTLVEKDEEMALYYLEKAISKVENKSVEDYPSLDLALAKVYLKDTKKHEPAIIYHLLLWARNGYNYEIENNNATYYQKNYEEVLHLLSDPIFDEYRAIDEEE